jgi:hypothetical protein
MILFGAGASFDSINIYPPGDPTHPREKLRPPLANDLFDDRPAFAEAINAYPQVRYLAHRLRGLPDGTGLETAIERMLAEDDPGGLLLKAVTAFRFYLQRTLWENAIEWSKLASGATNYLGLITDVRRYWRDRGPACFVTFNYEPLLEEGCRGAGITYPDIATYSRGQYPLFRPHGAVHWAHPVSAPVMDPNISLETAISEQISTLSVDQERFVSVERPGAGDAHRPVLPALSIPARAKDRFQMPAEHLQAMREWIPKVTHLLIIGWRAADAPFLNLWKSANADPRFKWVVAGSPTGVGTIKSELQKYGISAPSASHRGFGEFLKEEEHRYFFERA